MKSLICLFTTVVLFTVAGFNQSAPIQRFILTVQPAENLIVQTSDSVLNPFAALSSADSVHSSFLASAIAGSSFDSVYVELLDSNNTLIVSKTFAQSFGGNSTTVIAETVGSHPYTPYLLCVARIYSSGQLIQTITQTFSQL